MKIIPGNAQHMGNRQDQQDAFGFSEIDDAAFVAHGGVAAVLADGMGGHSMGRESSLLAVETFLAAYMSKPPEEPIPSALLHALTLANDAVYAMARKNHVENNCGTTLVAAVVAKGQLYFVSVGDSRIYLFHRGTLTCLTRDHVYADKLARLVEKGDMLREEAEKHPDRNALTAFLGLPQIPEIHQNGAPISIGYGDRIVLCSDGLYGSLDQRTMTEGLSLPLPQNSAEMLVQWALERNRKNQDNLTVAILAVGDMTSDEHADNKKPIRLPGMRSVSTAFIFLIVALLVFGIVWYWGQKNNSPFQAESAAPSIEQELPSTHQETPSADKETPSADQETPSADKEIPSAGQETPPAAKEIPSAEQKPPSDNQKTSLINQETSSDKRERPLKEENHPDDIATEKQNN